MRWFREFIEKRKWESIKKSDWVVIGLVGVLLLVIAMPLGSEQTGDENRGENYSADGGTLSGSTTTRETGEKSSNYLSTETSDEEYVAYLEKRLKNVLSQMEGVGQVEVMITIEDAGEYVIEKDETSAKTVTSETDNAGGSRTVTEQSAEETTIYVENGEGTYPYVQKEKLPTIEGVVVVAEGGDNSVVVSNISESVKALLPVEAHRIKVVKMCSKEE